jgi:membrane-associated protease RseP (regulator of RpoE activity)
VAAEKSRYSSVERKGVNAVEGIVLNELGWIFREQPTTDMGIDGMLGPFDLPNEHLSYVGIVERGAESLQFVAANFGEPILQQFNVTFDYGRNVVWLDPLPNRTPRSFSRMGLGLAKSEPSRFSVISVIKGSPAARAGLTVGDFIMTINGTPASTMAASDAKMLFLGVPGTQISLGVRKATGEVRDLDISLKEFGP